jgi:subtilase family serine protease
MRKRPLLASAAVALLGTTGLVVGGVAPSAGAVANQGLEHRQVVVCPSPPAGYAHCHAILNQTVTANGKPGPNASTPTGLSPTDYLSDYDWTNVIGSNSGYGQTIAIVDAYDDPTIYNDLTSFDDYFHLPTANFTKVNQTGGTHYPTANSGWALEISLDVEWAHAIAPAAKILLVEASSNSFSNLMAAESYAGSHAKYVTNSWGSSEFSGESAYDSSYFATPGVSYFASAGDTGGAVEYPSASPNVISVGGTTLSGSGSTVTETAWSSGGGGCSAYEQETSQPTSPISCNGFRATPDVSSDADPNSGVAVYDTTSYYGQTGWFEVGGTSAASPVWAARSADQGDQVNAPYVYAGYSGSDPYGTNITYRDITSGSNGYSAGTGYDLATGLGSWTGNGGTSGGTTGTAPAAPTNLAASVSGSSVDLSWSAASGANGYYVYRSTSSSGPFAQITSTTSTSYTDSPAAGTYYYEVASYNTYGTSSPTSPVGPETVGSATSSSMNVSVAAAYQGKKGPNYKEAITVAASDSSTSAALSGASVALDVYSGYCTSGTPTGGLVASGNGTTGTNGQVVFNFSTRAQANYCAVANVTDPGYNPGTGSVNFTS